VRVIFTMSYDHRRTPTIMIESKTWYAVSKPNGGRPHHWLYAIRVAEDPWGIGSQRWDFHDTDLDSPWRGESEKINDHLHRITVKDPLGKSEEYELRPLDEHWISHHASGFTAPPLMTLAGETVREHPSLEWVRGWLDHCYGNRIAWRETQLALMESRRQYLTEAMVETFIRECSKSRVSGCNYHKFNWLGSGLMMVLWSVSVSSSFRVTFSKG
jgi:hypothetical protein